jgi:outer membrane receptor for ferrienterochelin and colicins
MIFRRWAPVVVAVGIFCSAARVAAEDVADEAQFHFVRGNQFYRQGRFEEALSEFYASNRLVSNRNVQFNIARCLEQLKLYDEAFRAWSDLGRKEAPPAERATITGAIEKLRPHLALVNVTSEPSGAEIFANRRDLGSLGTTPRLLALPPGRTTILLDRPGYRSAEIAVELVKGKEQAVASSLDRIYGSIVFRGLPPGASIREGAADGPLVPIGPQPTRLVPGRHVLFVAAPGFQQARFEIDVAGDAVTPVDVPLAIATTPTGAVVVRANVEGALVRIDGREVGFTPAVIEGVEVGERQIEVANEGRVPYRARVTVEKGGRTFIDVRLKRLEPEVEAAAKRLMRAEDAPGSISIITSEQIRALGYQTLSEALRAVRGVVSSNDRTYEAVGFRGLSPPGDYTRRVLVLVDGHPYNDIVTGQGYVGRDLDVDLETVERIEVVRGSGSVLYGTGALFGVINVVTRRPAPGAHAEASAGLGTLGTTAGRVSAGVRGESAELWVSGAGYDSAGQLLYPWATTGDVAIGADSETAKHGDLLGRAGPFTLRAAINDRTKMVPTGVYATQPAPGTTYRDLRAFAELRFDQPWRYATLSARVCFDYGLFQGHYLQMMPPDLRDDFRSHWLTGEARLEVPLGNHHLTAGGQLQDLLEVKQRSFEDTPAAASYFSNDTKEIIASAYLVDDWAPSPRLRANLGLRADDYGRSFGLTVNPRLAVIAQPYRGGNSKLLLGRAFRAPSVYERFYNDMGATQIPAGPLSPETIVSGEIEHAHSVSDELQIVGAAFAEQLDNMVVLQPTPADPNVFVFVNQTDVVRGYGAEGEVRWEPGGDAFFAFALSWNHTRLQTAAGPQPLPNTPTHVASLRFIYPLVGAALRIGTEMVLDVARATVPSPTVMNGGVAGDALTWNLMLSGQAHMGARLRLRYFAGVFNLLDDRTGYPVGAEVPSGITVARLPRTARFGLAGSF